MTVSDLLTLIGIILAIIALISDRNRQFIYLKFSEKNWWRLAGAILFIHFLVSFNWLSNKIPFLEWIVISGFPTPAAWAYLITVGVLSFICLKIFYWQFPIENQEKVIRFYKNLLFNDETTLLLDLIKKYHSDDITEFLKLRKSIEVEEQEGDFTLQREHELLEKELQKKLNNKSNLKYGRSIYHGIITNELFLKKYASVRPYLFAPIIHELNDEQIANTDFVNTYMKQLFENKNELLFREIRNNQNFSDHKSYRIEKERPILYALFDDVKVATINEVSSGIGEPAISELKEESNQSHSLLREKETERFEELDTKWSFRTTNAIWYFDILMRRAIVQEVKDHIYIFYYRFFVKGLISNMNPANGDNEIENSSTRNYDLIKTIIDNTKEWLEVSRLAKNPAYIDPIYNTLGACIELIVKTSKLSRDAKESIVKSVWSHIIRILPDDPEDNEEVDIVNKIVDSGFDMLLNPTSTMRVGTQDPFRNQYDEILVEVWDGRDQQAINGPVEDNAEQFRQEVIDQIQ